MMLEFLGHTDAHDAIVRAIEDVLRGGPKTPDLGGVADTATVGEAIADRVSQA